VLDGRPRAELEVRGLALLEELGLGARADHRPEAMSGGEQQRVAIARALLFEPGVLLADEPTGNLDSASAERLWTILREVASRRQMTVVVVTHEPAAASNCVETFVLRDGVVAGRFESYGLTPSELVLRAAGAGR
jgi:putative ABC transport system ATP-binding protein